MDANLRRFDDSDRDAALALSRHALARIEEQVGKPLWSTRKELDDDLSSWRHAPADFLRVVEEDGRLAAFGGVQVDGDATVVGPLVASSFRGRKFGRTLLEVSIELARSSGADLLYAAVGAGNVGGRLLLERHGFRVRGGGLDSVYRLLPSAHRPAGPPPPGVVVRAGRADDVSAVWRLYREAFPIGRRTEAVWERWLEVGEVEVAERDGTVVAFAHVEPAARWITHVGVAEDARGLGVGGYLFSRALEDYWRDHPGQELRMTVVPTNTPAVRLYRRLGFAPWLVLEIFELDLQATP